MATGVQVSVVVPVYNGERTLEPTILSILAQSFSAMELLLVDDGSTDDSQAIIEPFLSDGRVRSFQQPNGGVASARNHGIREARGEWIAFCDQDDLWLPEKLTRQAALMGNPRVGLVYSWTEMAILGPDGVAKPSGQISRPRHRGDCVRRIFDRNFIPSCSAVARRSVVEDVGLLDEDRALLGIDDWHLWLRMAPLTEFDGVEEVLAYHVLHGENYSSNEIAMLRAEQVCLQKIRPFALDHGVPVQQLEDAEFTSLAHYAWNLFFIRDYGESARCWWKAWRVRPRALHALLYAALLFLTPGAIVTTARDRARRLRRSS
jgi:glycosyltransferase involved in cell wall biosynthesis